jgi:hypothetical protein
VRLQRRADDVEESRVLERGDDEDGALARRFALKHVILARVRDDDAQRRTLEPAPRREMQPVVCMQSHVDDQQIRVHGIQEHPGVFEPSRRGNQIPFFAHRRSNLCNADASLFTRSISSRTPAPAAIATRAAADDGRQTVEKRSTLTERRNSHTTDSK